VKCDQLSKKIIYEEMKVERSEKRRKKLKKKEKDKKKIKLVIINVCYCVSSSFSIDPSKLSIIRSYKTYK